MEFDDFKKFMDAAQTAFPSMKSWLGQQSPETRKATWKLWRKTLSGLTLHGGMEVIEKVLANRDLQPFGGKWEQFPGIILGLMSTAGQKPKGSRECICGGEGIVLVGVKYQANTFDGNPLRTFQKDGRTLCGPIGAACLCPVGKWIDHCRQKKVDSSMGPRLLPVYDPAKMEIVDRTDDSFAPAIAERERLAMTQAILDFDGTPVAVGDLDI